MLIISPLKPLRPSALAPAVLHHTDTHLHTANKTPPALFQPYAGKVDKPVWKYSSLLDSTA
jgi:hypothetical protein